MAIVRSDGLQWCYPKSTPTLRPKALNHLNGGCGCPGWLVVCCCGVCGLGCELFVFRNAARYCSGRTLPHYARSVNNGETAEVHINYEPVGALWWTVEGRDEVELWCGWIGCCVRFVVTIGKEKTSLIERFGLIDSNMVNIRKYKLNWIWWVLKSEIKLYKITDTDKCSDKWLSNSVKNIVIAIL